MRVNDFNGLTKESNKVCHIKKNVTRKTISVYSDPKDYKNSQGYSKENDIHFSVRDEEVENN